MGRAWVFKNKDAFLANRVLHSLDGRSVLLSDEDYKAVRELVSAAIANTGEEASGTIQDYSKALESLEKARERQLRTGRGSEFTLDLSKQPYSMRWQTKPEWLRDDVSKVLVSWTWKKVSEEHSRVPGTTVSLFLDDPVVAPFTTVEGGRLRSRLQNSAQIYGNAREIEDRCFDPNALPLAGVHLQSCAYNDDEDSARFRRTEHHLLDLWRDDVLLTSVATGRALTADETMSLIPLPLYKDFIHHQSKPMTHFSESKITRKKPSSYIAWDDPEWKNWLQEVVTMWKRNLTMSELPTRGYGSLFNAVRDIRAGKGKDVMRSRYGEGSEPFTIQKYFESISPLQRFMAVSGRLALSNLTDDEVMSRLPPRAYYQWKGIEAGREGFSIKKIIHGYHSRSQGHAAAGTNSADNSATQ
ncbi:hypothetical protein I311_00075 [Cryptococcus gattii NT-10]|nr:hypothetical protein I311_00075 [Cryptococcus gattii NT-10]